MKTAIDSGLVLNKDMASVLNTIGAGPAYAGQSLYDFIVHPVRFSDGQFHNEKHAEMFKRILSIYKNHVTKAYKLVNNLNDLFEKFDDRVMSGVIDLYTKSLLVEASTETYEDDLIALKINTMGDIGNELIKSLDRGD